MRSPFLLFREKLGSRGFSLLEVTIAIAVLSIAIVTIIQLYSMNLKSTQKAESYTEAVIYARSAMDMALSSDNLEGGSSTETVDDIYELTTTVTNIGNEEEIAKTYEVTVRITWEGGSFKLKARKSIPVEEGVE